MKTEIYLESTKGLFVAKGTYSPKQTVVLKGSKISVIFSASKKFKGAPCVLAMRDNRLFVDEEGNVLQDCAFNSPSTAAQFVTGRSTNGYVAWRVDNNTNLKRFVGK